MDTTGDALQRLFSGAMDGSRLRGEIGGVIYQLREEAGLSQDELGKKVGQNADWIDALEMGDFEGDGLTALKSVADALSVSVGASSVRIQSPPPAESSESRDEHAWTRILRDARAQSEIQTLAFQLRERAGMTQDELGRKVGHNADWIDALEVGDFEENRWDSLKSIADALGVDVNIEMERIRKME